LHQPLSYTWISLPLSHHPKIVKTPYKLELCQVEMPRSASRNAFQNNWKPTKIWRFE
jgi:hypothetical protein